MDHYLHKAIPRCFVHLSGMSQRLKQHYCTSSMDCIKLLQYHNLTVEGVRYLMKWYNYLTYCLPGNIASYKLWKPTYITLNPLPANVENKVSSE